MTFIFPGKVDATSRPKQRQTNGATDPAYSDGLTASGETSNFLPNPEAFMRAGAQLQTINAVVRNIRIQRLYIESDR